MITIMVIFIYDFLYTNKHTGKTVIQKCLQRYFNIEQVLTGVNDLVARGHGGREQEAVGFEGHLELPHPGGEGVLVGGGALVAVHLCDVGECNQCWFILCW